MDLSIIIVNWKSAMFLQSCLWSLYRQKPDILFEVIVVDNDSGDGCREMLARDFPFVRYLQNPVNLGFANANNLGFTHSQGSVLLFLNPDTEIIGNAIFHLYATLTGTTVFGAIGGKLLNSDKSLQTSCILPFPTILNQVLDADYLKKKFPSWNLWQSRPLSDNPAAPSEVEAVSGACLMVKRFVFDYIGRFSDNYFMYSEDVDLCYKIRRAGWKVVYSSGAQIIHHGGKSSLQSKEQSFGTVMMRESIFIFLKKYHSTLYAAAYRCAMALASALRLVLLCAAIPVTGSVPVRKWIKVLRWSLGLEPWATQLQHKAAA